MHMNEHIALCTPKVLLVPYSRIHVPTYHEWLQNEDLRKATASEPLTLDEEYAMQTSWRTDRDKLTFIVCQPAFSSHSKVIASGHDDAPSRMIGDVNLFLVDDDNDHDDGLNGQPASTFGPRRVVGELEVMIARQDLQRQGYGLATLRAFIPFIRENMDALLAEYNSGDGGGRDGEVGGQGGVVFSYLRVKIGKDNTRSIALFQRMGFKKVLELPNVFDELELRRNIDHMGDRCDGYEVIPYQMGPVVNGGS